MLNEIDGQLHDLTAAVMNYGHFKQSRTGHGTYMLPAQMMRFNLGGLRMPILSTRLVRYINSIHEMDMFKTGSPQLKPLCDRKIGIWDSWFIPGTAVYAEPKFEELPMDERAQLAIDAGLYEEINQFIAGVKERDPGIGSSHIHFTLNGVRSGWLNLSRGLWIAVGKKLDEYQIPNTRQVQDGEEVSLKKRLSRVSKNDAEKWGVIYPCLIDCHATFAEENPVKVSAWNAEAKAFEDLFLDPTKTDVVVKLLDELQVPKYRLLDASIGEGSYGVQWRKWQDTQLVKGLYDGPQVKAYLDQGYEFKGWLDANEEVDSGQVVMYREIDQLQNIIDMLKSNPDDRRMIMTAWNPARTWQAALPPCHLYFQVVSWEMGHSELESMLENRGLFQDFLNQHRDEQGRLNEDVFSDKDEAIKLLHAYIKEKELPTRAITGFVLLRSSDVPAGAVFNVIQYAYLLHSIAHVVGMEAVELITVGVDAHVYANQIEAMEEMLELGTDIENNPKIRFKEKFTDIDDITADGVEIYGYVPGKDIHIPIAV